MVPCEVQPCFVVVGIPGHWYAERECTECVIALGCVGVYTGGSPGPLHSRGLWLLEGSVCFKTEEKLLTVLPPGNVNCSDLIIIPVCKHRTIPQTHVSLWVPTKVKIKR